MRQRIPIDRHPFATLRRSVSPRHATALERPGFTLIELMVVISIILLVAAITLSAVNMSISGDRVRGAARQVQSYLEGARDRAIYGGFSAVRSNAPDDAQAVGVRFIPDPQNQYLVTSFVYVQQVNPFSSLSNNQTINILNNGGTGGDKRSITFPANTALAAIPQELIPPMAEIQISPDNTFDSTDSWYWVIKPASASGRWVLTSDYQGAGLGPFMGLHYKIKLLAEPMANQEPRQLGNGVVIDLRRSRIPGNWRTPTGYSNRMDLMFDSRGTVAGMASSLGMIEFYISDRQDALLGAPACASLWDNGKFYNAGDCVAPTVDPTVNDSNSSIPLIGARNAFIYQLTSPTGGGTSGGTQPTWPTTAGVTVTDAGLTWTCLRSPDGCSSAVRERLIVSLMPQTGATAVHPVYVSQTTENADPFRYAETGEVAKQ